MKPERIPVSQERVQAKQTMDQNKADNGSSTADKGLSRETYLPENHVMPLPPTTQTIVESSDESLFDRDFNDLEAVDLSGINDKG